MKRFLMQCLLLMAVVGYFFASVHTQEHIAGDLAHHHVHTEFSTHDHGHVQKYGQHDHNDAEEQHECLICTVHSHFIALLPPDDASFRFAELSATHQFIDDASYPNHAVLNPLKARAPPIS